MQRLQGVQALHGGKQDVPMQGLHGSPDVGHGVNQGIDRDVTDLPVDDVGLHI